jgi:hypothetical protein
MLGAERLVHGRLGGDAVHRAHRRHAGAPRVGHRQPAIAGPRATCTGSTPRPASGWSRCPTAMPPGPAALDRPPRRRQAGAREHAGRLPPRRRPRLPGLRVRREAAPTACPSCCTTPRWNAPPRPRHGRRAALVRAVARRRRQLAQPRHAGEPLPTSRPSRASAWQRPCAEHRDQAHARAGERTGRGRGAGRAAAGPGQAGAAAAQFVPAEALEGARGRRALPRALLVDSLAGLVRTWPGPGLRGGGGQPHADGRRIAWSSGCTPPACARWPTPSTTAHGARLLGQGIDGMITDAVDRFSPHAGRLGT